MNNKKYNWLLYLITATILTTIAVQLYWNYKNYEQNKQRVLNEIQLSLDNAIEKYYNDLSKNNIITIVEEEREDNFDKNKRKNIFRKIFKTDYPKKDSVTIHSIDIKTEDPVEFTKMKSQFIDSATKIVTEDLHSNFKDSVPKKYSKITGFSAFSDDKKSGISVNAVSKEVKNIKGAYDKTLGKRVISSLDIITNSNGTLKQMKSNLANSISLLDTKNYNIKKGEYPFKVKSFTQFSDDLKSGLTVGSEKNEIKSVRVFRGKNAADSIKLIKGLQTVFIALKNDTLKYNKIDSILKRELKQKNIKINYAFEHYKKDTLFSEFNPSPDINKKYSALSKSTYFAGKQNLKLNYTNPTLDTLKRSSTGILLSLLLSLAIISSLFYLLKIINQQKQLAEIKNDLISNITHEFKTPIATVSTAVEALENFNAVNDTEKTKKYLNISSVQLKKLHGMVEKLLETATLDSEKLLLNKETIDIIGFTEKIVNKHKLIAPEKNIQFSSNTKELLANIDNFHLENAISNLVDNAVKYGGNAIDISIPSVLKTIEITVADNGKGIDKSQQEKIFDKFYRVPKGNVHDVKGFGIGLYYTKKIIEKHNGTIALTSKPNSTIFKITLPNE